MTPLELVLTLDVKEGNFFSPIIIARNTKSIITARNIRCSKGDSYISLETFTCYFYGFNDYYA